MALCIDSEEPSLYKKPLTPCIMISVCAPESDDRTGVFCA